MVDEWIDELDWYPPYHKNVRKLDKFIDVSKGKYVEVTIIEKPQNLDRLKEWIEYRREIGKPVIAFRTYLTVIKKHAIGVQMHEDQFPIFITLDTYDIYVKRTWKQRSANMRSALRYVLYYAGYRLHYKTLNVRAERFKKTVQTELCSIT
ncbi:MAG: hypothetical protein J7J61_09625 [Candidatus Hydrothermae bacterium]|nr:hypothetical protein [Candidatus Hydrothermae bacterium]